VFTEVKRGMSPYKPKKRRLEKRKPKMIIAMPGNE
jgi:hypothetical protein